MAVCTCMVCDFTEDKDIFEFWRCNNCGEGSYLRPLSYTQEELSKALDYVERFKTNVTVNYENSVILMSQDIAEYKGGDATLIDSLLLIYDKIIVPSRGWNAVEKLIGQEKAEKYRQFNLIECFNTHIEHPWESDNTNSLFDVVLSELREDSCFYTLVNNLGDIFKHRYTIYPLLSPDIVSTANSLEKLDSEPKKHSLNIKYFDPGYFFLYIRGDFISRVTNGFMLCDSMFNLFKSLVDSHAYHRPPTQKNEQNLFHEWMKSEPLPLKEIPPDDLIEFRDKHGSMGPFLSQIKHSLSIDIQKDDNTIIYEFSKELNKRIKNASKLKYRIPSKAGKYTGCLVGAACFALNGVLGALTRSFLPSVTSDLVDMYREDLKPEIQFLMKYSK